MKPYKFQPHGAWIAGVYKTYCQNCGLVRLNNEFTDWAIKMGCNNQDHPDYERQRAKAGRFARG